MSEEPVSVECSMCGVAGGPREGCDLCHGNQRFVQTRAYTRSEEIQGKNPDAKKRYGVGGDVNPKVVVLPGGFDPRQNVA